jgi:hypothetical protein
MELKDAYPNPRPWKELERELDFSNPAAGMNQYSEYLLSRYNDGGFDSPQDFYDQLTWARGYLFPRDDIPDPGDEWESNLMRQIGYKKTPEGIMKLDDLDLNLQSKREDILGTINWPYG